MRVHVLGTGLIGTSIGLALRGQAEVLLSDPSADHLATAVERGAGRTWDGLEVADLFVACTPPGVTAGVLADAIRRGLASTYSHVASAQSAVQAEIETLVADVSALCGGHPLAGRERGGPSAATARLFVDRPWVVCPSPTTAPSARSSVATLATECGAVVTEAAPDAHDAAVALVSHLPQLAASAVAARLLGNDPTRRLDEAPPSGSAGLDPTQLAGPGVQDTTRVAASDPALWVDVLRSNARHVAPVVHALAEDLARAAAALDLLAAPADDPRAGEAERAAAAAVVRDLLERGRAGRARLPLKQRGTAAPLAAVLVSVPDRPGQLAGVLVSAADAQVNVEDVRVEHLPGRTRGLVELLVTEADAARARRALSQAGWDVVDPT